MFNKLKKRTIISMLALSLCVGAIAAYAAIDSTQAQAETIGTTATTPKMEIISQNVSYADSLYILYAVSNEGFDRNTNEMTMLFWDTPQETYEISTATYMATNKGSATVKDKDCWIFYSKGLAAKEMTTDVYCRAYAEIDGVTYYSDVKKYSVLEYVYEKTEKGDLTEKESNMFNAMLNYGAAAQTLLNYKTNRLANGEYYTVNVVNGTLSDGFTSGRYNAAETVMMTANVAQEEKEFAYWMDETGNEVGREETLTICVNANSTYTAVYEEIIEETKGTDGLVYTLSDDGTYYSVTGYEATETDVAIPSKYKGLPVRCIGESAFYGCTSLTSMEIPHSVTSIGDSAFSYCFDLTSIEIPDSVTSIGDYAFNSCSSLTSVEIPDGVTSIGKGTFFGCSSLTSVEIPDGVTSIGEWAFTNCFDLTSVEIPNSVTSIGESAFYYCSNLTGVEISDSVTSIGECAFSYCSSLTNIKVSGNNAN